MTLMRARLALAESELLTATLHYFVRSGLFYDVSAHFKNAHQKLSETITAEQLGSRSFQRDLQSAYLSFSNELRAADSDTALGELIRLNCRPLDPTAKAPYSLILSMIELPEDFEVTRVYEALETLRKIATTNGALLTELWFAVLHGEKSFKFVALKEGRAPWRVNPVLQAARPTEDDASLRAYAKGVVEALVAQYVASNPDFNQD